MNNLAGSNPVGARMSIGLPWIVIAHGDGDRLECGSAAKATGVRLLFYPQV
jgi:hypothetical protein